MARGGGPDGAESARVISSDRPMTDEHSLVVLYQVRKEKAGQVDVGWCASQQPPTGLSIERVSDDIGKIIANPVTVEHR